MSEIIEKIKQELADFNEKKQAMIGELRRKFPELFKHLFGKSNKIDSISWTQYTPYFNDGDSCEFGVYNDNLYINGEYDDPAWYSWRSEYPEYHEELSEKGKVDLDECQIVRDFKEILQSIPDEFYEDLFGDHVMVTIFKDGRVEVEEYSHD